MLATLRHPLVLAANTRVLPRKSPFLNAPAFQAPVPYCSFSYDENRQQWHDDRSRKYFRGPPPPTNKGRIDLNYGFDGFVQHEPQLSEHLDGLVRALQHRSTVTLPEQDEERRKADVVTWRGIMTKLCAAFYQNPSVRFANPFTLDIMLIDGTLYIDEYISASHRAEKEGGDATLQRFRYYGYAFESYCTVESAEQTTSFPEIPSSGSPPFGWSGDVNTNVQWCQVVRTKLGDHRLIIGGEVDAVTADERESVEIKTSMALPDPSKDPVKAQKSRVNFEKKLLNFFLQSFLLGTPTILVGFRDWHGNVLSHQIFETLKIPRLVRAGQPIAGLFGPRGEPVIREESVWEPKDSLGFADQILSFLRNTIRARTEQSDTSLPKPEDALLDYPVYRLSFQMPFDRLELRSLSREEVATEVKDNGRSGPRVGFLPLDFYRFIHSRSRGTSSRQPRE